MTRQLIYLAAPYSHPRPQLRRLRVKDATTFERGLTCAGAMVYNPLRYSAALADIADDDTWRAHGLRLLTACDILVVLQLPGWDESVGVKAEIVAAERAGKPVYYHAPGNLADYSYSIFAQLVNAYAGRLQ